MVAQVKRVMLNSNALTEQTFNYNGHSVANLNSMIAVVDRRRGSTTVITEAVNGDFVGTHLGYGQKWRLLGASGLRVSRFPLCRSEELRCRF